MSGADRGPSSGAAAAAQPPAMLLVEPNFMLRRTIALTARNIGVGEIHECSSYEAAERTLSTLRCDGVFIALNEEPGGMRLISRLREGATACAADVTIAVMADQFDKARVDALLAQGVARILLKPIKVRHIFEAVAALSRREPAAAPATAN
ncbi:MAG: hypothetical protein JWN73_1423 [Betaproteobacteria bacterium]|nr:hypothetical protein [Betaproteobacteria bacterium]